MRSRVTDTVSLLEKYGLELRIVEETGGERLYTQFGLLVDESYLRQLVAQLIEKYRKNPKESIIEEIADICSLYDLLERQKAPVLANNLIADETQSALVRAIKEFTQTQDLIKLIQDIGKILASIADDAMRAAFFVGAVIPAVALIPGVGPGIEALLKTIYSFVWNGVDGVAGAAGIGFGKERSSAHNGIWDKVQLVSAAQLLIGTGLNLLHTLGGFGPAAFGALNGITFAVCMWISAAQEAHYTYRAVHKFMSPNYFAQERREAIEAELKLLRDKENPPTKDELFKIKKKIMVLQKQADALEYYAEHQDGDNIPEDKKQDMALAKFLIAKEKDKALEHGIKCGVWVGAGAVMTAATIVFPPAVLIAGLFVGVAKVLQIGHEKISDKCTDAARNHAGKGSDDDLLTRALNGTELELNTAKESLSDKDRLELINKQARREYTQHLKEKVEEKISEISTTISTKVSETATRVSTTICSFFAKTFSQCDNKIPLAELEMIVMTGTPSKS
jgi:hypothetical protein